jgi:hypothetical protein
MKAVAELRAEDFPGIDPAKFYAWQTAAGRIRKNWTTFFIVLVLANLVVIPLTGHIILGVGLLPMIIMFLLNREPSRTMRTLAADLGLDAKTLREARRGIVPFRFQSQ